MFAVFLKKYLTDPNKGYHVSNREVYGNMLILWDLKKKYLIFLIYMENSRYILNAHF